MIPFIAGIDLEWIKDHIGLFIAGFFFFVVPILQGLRKSAEEKRASEAKGQKPPAELRDEEQAARKAWEDLMRGDAPTTTQAAPPAVPVPPPIQRVEPLEPANETRPLSGKLSDLSAAEAEDEAEATYDEEKLARDQNERTLREEMQRRADFLTRSKELAARKTVSAPDMSTSEFGAEASGVSESAAARRRDLLGLAGDRRSALRRAMVAQEVFGRPLALRRPFDGDHV